jgi:HD-GYP domain-containing protein (c-di-GMP phosphodiesterase class II)
MTSTRAYRKALPVSDAIAEIRRCSGTRLDPDIVNLLSMFSSATPESGIADLVVPLEIRQVLI